MPTNPNYHQRMYAREGDANRNAVMSASEVARVLNISKARVQQIEWTALKKLRLRAKQLRSELEE